jgi:cytochrome c-type biogenesis protein CcsB
MTVDATLATYSDWSYAGAVVVYVLALLLHGAQFAVTRQRPTPDRALQPALTGAADTTPAVGPPASVWSAVGPVDGDTDASGRAARFGRMAVALTVLGAVVHAVSLLLRGLAVGRVPWGNMYEFGSTICLAAVVCWLVVMRRHDVQRLGVFVLLPVVLLLFTSGTLLYAQAAPLMPALRSYWIIIHVSVAAVSSGMLMVAGAASVGFLVRTANEDNPSRFASVAARLPGAEVLDRIAYRATIAAFPVWTFAIITGAVWAETAWGRYWGWDPKETVSLVAWVIYAGYLHARATAGWRRGGAWVNVVGFLTMIFNLFFVNLVVSGFHSYAGV